MKSIAGEDGSKMMMEIELRHEDGSTEIVSVPSHFEVCERCQGKGSHDAWEGGMTADEMEEQGPDFIEDYLSGVYDVKCTVCNGLRVVEVISRERISPEILAAYDREQQELAELQQMEMSERWFGC